MLYLVYKSQKMLLFILNKHNKSIQVMKKLQEKLDIV